MQFVFKDSYEEMSAAVADLIAEQIKQKPNSILGLATGSTPIGAYDCLADLCKCRDISFSEIETFNLDEYVGLAPDNVQSYRYFMNEHLFKSIDIEIEKTHVLDGLATDADKVCADYERAIDEAGGIDLQLLGLGHDGHIGFNEPADEFPPFTHKVELEASTIAANSRLFDSIDEVPRFAYTMGIGTIMKAKKIILAASGADKAEIVAKAFKGEIKPQIPASILQSHPDCTIVLDKSAAINL